MADYSGVKLKKSEINKEILLALYNIYGEYLRNNTFTGSISQHKAKVINDWKIKPKDFMVFQFSNRNYFDVYMQEYGIRPQIITVKNKKFLRFKKPTGRKSSYRKIPGNIAFEKDGYIYAKMVFHPGFEGRRFIEKMLTNQDLWNRFAELVSINIDKLVDTKARELQQELKKL